MGVDKFLFAILITVMYSPSLAFADSKKNEKLKCMDLAGGLEIIAKLSPKEYEIDFWDIGVPRTRMLLFTDKTEFARPGVVGMNRHLWVEVHQKAEIREVMMKNGFKKKFQVARESAACTVEGLKSVAKQQAVRKKQDAENLKKAMKETLEDKARRAKEIEEIDKEEAAHQKAIKEGHEDEYLQEQADQRRAAENEQMQRQQEDEDKTQATLDKEGQALEKTSTAWFTMPIEKRKVICTKMRGSSEGCDDPTWIYPPGWHE